MRTLMITAALIFGLTACTGGDGFAPLNSGNDNVDGSGGPDGGNDNNNGSSGGDNSDNGSGDGSGSGDNSGDNSGGGNTGGGGNAGGGNNGGGGSGGGNTGPKPGDIVQVSPGETNATYPPVGSEVPPVPNPGPEPGSDTFDPIIAIVSVPEPIISENDASIEIWVADNDGGRGIERTECSLNGGAFSECEQVIELNDLPDGLHTIVAHTIDRDDNQSGDVSYTFLVDTTSPIVVFTEAPNSPSGSPNAHFEFEGQDGSQGSGVENYQCSLDGGAFEDCPNVQDISGLADGEHTLTVIATDNAGNASQPVTHTWTIDTDMPTIQITKQPNDPTNDSGAEFAYVGADNDGVNGYECSIDGGAYASCGNSINYQNLGDGNHSFAVVAIDMSGNRSSPATYNWVIDTVKPTVAITKSPNNPTNLTGGQFEFSGNDDRSGVASYQCSIDGGAMQACNGTFDFSNLSDGNHTFSVIATDQAGNQSDPATYSWLIDTVPPQVQIVSGPDNPTAEVSAEFVYSATDLGSGISGYQCSFDGKPYKFCNNPEVYIQLVEGNHTFSVQAIDNAGNISQPADYWWVIDRTGPAINFEVQPPSVVYIGEDGPIRFVVDDPSGVDNYTCTLNGNAQACSSGVDLQIPATAIEDFTFVVVATDSLGNQATAEITWSADYNYDDKVTQLMVDEDRPVDLMFVIDNSISMDSERQKLAERFDGLVNKVDGLDWQIAVISTDSTTNDNKSDGRFIELIGMDGEYILDSNMDLQTAQTVFGNTVQGFGSGSGNEEGIYSARRAIDRYKDGEANHQKFFRDGADLSIIVLSDEDEASQGTSIRMQPQAFVDYVDETWNGQKNMVFHSIIVRPGDQACKDEQDHYFGDIYDQLSRLTGYGQSGGAIIGSVCENDYTSQLADIGQSVKDRQNTITLECEPADTDQNGQPEIMVEYQAAGAQGFSQYNGSRQLQQGVKLVFDDLLPPGDYRVNYKCLAN